MREFGSKVIRKSTRAQTHAKGRLRKTTRPRRWLPRPSLRAEIFDDEFFHADVDIEAVVVVGVLVVGVVLLLVFVE